MLILFTILRLRFLVQGTYSIDATELKKKDISHFKIIYILLIMKRLIIFSRGV